MVAPAAQGIDLFKIAGRSISGWIPSLKTGAATPRRQPFCSQTEPEPERETVSVNHESHVTETVIKAGEQVHTAKTPKCTFPGVVSIELKRF